MDPRLDKFYYFHRGRKDSASSDQDYDEALVNNMRGIKISHDFKTLSRYPNLYEQKGLVEIAQGERSKSVRSLRKALNWTHKFNCGPIYEQLGISLLELKQIEEAKEQFEKAYEIGHSTGKMSFHWGLCYERLNEKLKALKKYRLSEKQLPFSTVFGRNHFRVLQMIDKGKYKNADKECKFLIKINKDFVYAYFNRAIVLFCQGRLDKGFRTFYYIYTRLPKIYPKERKIVKKYQKYLRRSQEKLKREKDEKQIKKLNRKIQAIERLLLLFSEHSPQKKQLYTVYLPRILLGFTIFLVLPIFFVLLFPISFYFILAILFFICHYFCLFGR